MGIYQTTPMYFDLAAGTAATNWFRMLSSSTNHERSIQGTLTTGDSIVVQFTNEKLVDENNILQTAVSTTNVVASPAQTTNPFELSYVGNYRWVRIVKNGSTGPARVIVEC
jgi:hypothetical protein